MTCLNPRSMLALWMLLLAAALIPACGEKEEPDPGSNVSGETIVYTKTGGLAGATRQLRIAPAGTVTVAVDGESPRPVEVEAGLVERARGAVGDIRFDRLEVPPTNPTADGFEIELTYGTDSVSGDEARLLALQPLRPALSALDAILAATTASDEPRASGSAASQP